MIYRRGGARVSEAEAARQGSTNRRNEERRREAGEVAIADRPPEG